MEIYKYKGEFRTESGFLFPSLDIAYDTYGSLNEGRDNVIWVCHALTASSDVASWWPGMVGEGRMLDSSRYFIVCANIPGSCYGSTGPLSVNDETGEPWFLDFPILTIRDVVNALDLVRRHLGINRIRMVIGSSVGGQQALEYSIMYPSLIEKLVFIASNARQSPWAVAFNESQRLAVEADPSFRIRNNFGGREGLRAARSIALLSYRNHVTYNRMQAETSDEVTTGFRASSYQAYQGDKLVRRFNAWSYYRLTQMTDTHNVGRGRGGLRAALSSIQADVLCIGIRSDLLFPVDEMVLVAGTVPRGCYAEIDSDYGHDGFLTEAEKLTSLVVDFLSTGKLVLQ
ncbi:MAG: homoserine O-acetyltransferase [Bacteroidales bacterium]|jgi:homoserine O-acetyltransferase|nr:homoserine O-acetyltransferase [Bacteroidales bacterium]